MKKVQFALLAFVLLIFSCSKEGIVRVVDKNFDREIEANTSLSFTFNKDMVPDSLVGFWISDKLIDFDPKIPGKFSWQSSRTLVFLPDEEFLPATEYTCKITSGVLKHNKKLSLSGEKQFTFHTPLLQILSTRAFWDAPDGNYADPILKVNVGFNYKVDPKDLEKLVDIKVEDKTVNFKSLSTENVQEASFEISDIKKEDKDLNAEVTIKKGLTPVRGSIETDEDFVEQFDIPSPFKLNIVEVVSNHDGTAGTITVYTSQAVTEKNIKDFISIEPTVKYTIEAFVDYFLIKSDEFRMDSKYDLVLKQGLTGKIGGELKYEFSQPISFGEVEPALKFVNNKEFYVSAKGSRNIEVAIVNVPKVNITVTKIYENNILSYLKNQNSYYYDEYYYEDYDYYDYYGYNSNPGALGDIVFEKEIETSELPRQGINRVLTLDFEDKLADYPGLYVIEVKGLGDHWLQASKMLTVSDIGLIVKEGKNNITVFANSIKTAQPLSNVEITFIGQNNQVTGKATTDASGVAVFEYTELKASGFATSMITAKLGSDYNVVPLDRTRVNTSRFDVGGKYQNPSGIEAYIYGDRDLYRPGETVNIAAIIRDYNWKSPGTIPVILQLIAPNGKNYKTVKKTLDEYGSFETQIEILPTAGTGSYVANVYTTNNVLIGSEVIKVEEFMPDRIKVEFTLNKPDYKAGENIEVSIKAENFFGPPAANRNYEVQVTTSRAGFYSKENPGYNYSIQGAENYFSDEMRENKTGSDGTAIESFEIPESYKNMGLLNSSIFVTVFDETGRPVNRLKNISIYTQDIFYGIRTEDYYVKTGTPAVFNLIAVDKKGKALTNKKAEIKLIKHEYKTVLSRSGDYFRYRSEKVEKVVEQKTVTLNETSTNFSFIPDLSGSYELRIASPGVSTYVSQYLYAYGWGSTTYSSFKVDNEGEIDIQLDKEQYNVGEKAKVLFKCPFAGKILVTVETDKVIDHFYIETDKRAATFDLDIKDSYLPNVYISATLFRPHEKSDIPLTVAHGYKAIKVDNPDYKMPIQITAVEKSRSNIKQKIKIKAQPNASVTIAVVDEGILQVAGYGTPDPYGFYYQRRALEINTSDIYPYIFPELGAVKSSTGGDASDMGKRLNPLKDNRVKLVSFWSGIIETNSRGEAEFDIDIPQFSGDLRVMAVGFNKTNVFGSAQANMKVADPIVQSVALPRFFSPGDKVEVPVILTNTTTKAAKCKTKIEVTGPLKIVGESSGSVTIQPNSEERVFFNVDAELMIGSASITVRTEALGEEFVNKTEISVRPSSPLQKRSGAGVLAAGKSIKIDMKSQEFIESSTDYKLIVSNSPLVQFSNSLDYLVRYPYGCIEQTVSAAFPQIYFSDLMGTIYSQKRAKDDAIQNVQAALDKIKLMQLYNGGLTYWPGGGYESWWGSVYAAHFAIEAKKAGYDVDQSFIDNLMRYLKDKVKDKTVFTYYFNVNQKKDIAPKEVAYSLYVLSLAGEKPTALLNYYRTHPELLSLDCKYLLAGAYALTGDTRKFKEIVPEAFEGEKAVATFGGSFYSFIRDEAIALNVLLEVDPENSQVGTMAKHLSDQLRTQRYLNTQERSFGFLAMGKIARKAATSNISGTIKVDGKEVGTFKNNTLVVSSAKLKGKDITFTTEGSGNAYYFWESEGITKDGSYLEEDSYISIRKRFYDRNGSSITSNEFTQNDLVLVELAISGLTENYIENVAISDILPAGFEIENPRLTTLPPGMDFPHERYTPDYIDIRDDRINMFVGVNSYTRYYYYLVRAVSPGEFKMGPVGADAMYNGEYHSYSGGGTIKIVRK